MPKVKLYNQNFVKFTPTKGNFLALRSRKHMRIGFPSGKNTVEFVMYAAGRPRRLSENRDLKL